MEHAEEDKSIRRYLYKHNALYRRYVDNGSIHKGEHIPSEVHDVHERPRNSARVRLRLRFVVAVCSSRSWSDSRQAARTSASQYLHDFGIRERDIEKIEFHQDSYWLGPFAIATATIKNAADRIEDNDGSTSQ